MEVNGGVVTLLHQAAATKEAMPTLDTIVHAPRRPARTVSH